MIPLRLRQLVIAAESLDSAAALKTVLGLGERYPDPGVAEFGLVNAVFAIGDQFLEVVVPTTPEAPASRFMKRGGEGGYMVILQTGDIRDARARAESAGIRRVWNIDLDDIAASHLHPADTGGAILSIDQPVPPECWRWAGPGWQARTAPGSLTGALFESPDPQALAAKWAAALGRAATTGGNAAEIALDDSVLVFEHGPREHLAAFRIALPDTDAALGRARDLGLVVNGTSITLAGTRLDLG